MSDINFDALLNGSGEPKPEEPPKWASEMKSSFDQALEKLENTKTQAPAPQVQAHAQNNQQPLTNEQIVDWANNDKIGYANAVIQLAVQQATQAAQQVSAGSNIDILTRQKKAENPHLANFEQDIHRMASEQYRQALARGENKPVEEFIDNAIKHYDGIVKPLMGQTETQRLQGLQLNVGANTPSQSNHSVSGWSDPALLERAKTDPELAQKLSLQYRKDHGVSNYYLK